MNNEKGPKLAAVAQCQDKKSSLFQKYDFAKWILYDVWRLDKRVRLCCVPSRALLPSYVHSCTRATTSIRKFVNTLLPSHARLCMCYFFRTYVRARATSFALAFVHVLFFVRFCTRYFLRTRLCLRVRLFVWTGARVRLYLYAAARF